jgi:hypothetical protein
MKKKICIFIVALLVLITAFAAVSFVRHGRQSIEITINTESNDDDRQSMWNRSSIVAKGEDGYYFLAQDNVNMGVRLKYYGDKLDSSITVCGKAECSHTGTDCNAYFNALEYLSAPLYYYHGNIYMIKLKNGMSVLTKISPDGAKREEIAELFPNSNVTSVNVIFHDDYAYVYDTIGHSGSSEENTEYIKKVSLAGKSSEIVFEYTGTGSSIGNAKSFGDKLFFEVEDYQVNKETAEYSSKRQLYTFDYKTGASEKILQENISGYHVDMEQSILYYFVIGDGLYKCSLDGSEKKLIFKADATMVVAALSFDGTYLYMENGGMGSTTNLREKIDRLVYVLDKDGSVVNTIPMSKNAILYFGDEEYLFGKDNDKLIYIDKKDIATATEWVTLY